MEGELGVEEVEIAEGPITASDASYMHQVVTPAGHDPFHRSHREINAPTFLLAQRLR